MLRRSVDIAVALVLLLLAAPLLLVTAVAIRLDSPGPVLYTPRMLGYRRKVFTLLRFRTMVSINPNQRKGAAPQRSYTGDLEKLSLTRVGRFIRNISFDHLPMLLNLLAGDLTLVGPRPMEPERVDLSDPTWIEYFQAKPGLINYAVLKLGKSWNLSRARSPGLNQELELEYRQEQNARRDLGLVLQSLRALVHSRGNIKARGVPDPAAEATLEGETELTILLRDMQPELHDGVYVFCTVDPQAVPPGLELLGTFREGEGLTLILSREQADASGIPYTFESAWITLSVNSSLTAVGLTAAVSQALAQAGISCNVVAAYHHDHLFVPSAEAQRALDVLLGLASV